MDILNNYSIYNEDAIERLKQLESDSIDCIITDPPLSSYRWWFWRQRFLISS